MLRQLRACLVFVVLITLLTGFAYPLGLAGLAKFIFPYQANGSLVVRDGKVIGSEIIGQAFTGDRYFHGRPSAVGYNAGTSGGTNLGPTSKTLLKKVRDESENLHKHNSMHVPVDLVTSSASGLDPHITPAAAEFQVQRISAARGWPETRIMPLVAQYTEPRTLGFIGEPVVNVLKLNMALDEMAKPSIQ